jgi:hypothetical protein
MSSAGNCSDGDGGTFDIGLQALSLAADQSRYLGPSKIVSISKHTPWLAMNGVCNP